jgi:hypothetical protein
MGQYPSGVIDWGNGAWEIGTPLGKFGTFNLIPSDRKATKEEFSFYAPRLFAGVDVYNDGNRDATLTVRSTGNGAVSRTIQPKEVVRLRTGWREQSLKVSFEFVNGQGLRFDNLAYIHP